MGDIHEISGKQGDVEEIITLSVQSFVAVSDFISRTATNFYVYDLRLCLQWAPLSKQHHAATPQTAVTADDLLDNSLPVTMQAQPYLAEDNFLVAYNDTVDVVCQAVWYVRIGAYYNGQIFRRPIHLAGLHIEMVINGYNAR